MKGALVELVASNSPAEANFGRFRRPSGQWVAGSDDDDDDDVWAN